MRKSYSLALIYKSYSRCHIYMLQVDSNFLYLLIFRFVSIYWLALFSGSHGKLVWKVKVISII